MTPLPIANGAYVSESLPLSAQQCVNWYPHVPDAPALNQEVLFGTPGSVQEATAGNSILNANRGTWRMEGKPYFVQGQALFRLNQDRTIDNLGFVEGVGRVSMADNGTQLVIQVPGGKGYVFTENPDSLTEITDGDFRANGNPQYVAFHDSFFIFTTDEKRFIKSDANDGLSYNALDFGAAESSPDGVVAPIVYKNQLFICGERTIEAFQNIGGADFPYQRTGLFLDEGVIAPSSLVSAADSFLFVGAGDNEGPAIWALSGNNTQKVSTKAIDQVLQRLLIADLQNIHAWSYAQSGHYFVGFVLPDTTFVYDTSTGRWHERQSRITNNGVDFITTTCRISSCVSAYGEIFVGDLLDGRIGKLDPDVYTEYGSLIVRPVATQPFQNNMQPFSVPYLEMTVESGLGNDAVNDPVMALEVSRDGGKTWSDSRIRKLGKRGEFKRRAIWRRNGRTDRFDVYRFTLSDPVKPVLLQLNGEFL